ncbi:MAG: methyltransferase domain-containing protein [Acidimicrobiales bacterium]|nr:methyltransferase domain-containing protein [Acidimicrobiales bacterium]
MTDPYEGFPPGFFEREDESGDEVFYEPARMVTHIDQRATAAVGEIYRELAITGQVLDLMGSWVSHFADPPTELTVLGMNELELANNPVAENRVIHDLNRSPTLPFPDERFDHVVCCASVDYLTWPVEVFAEVNRVLRPAGVFVCTFSNRCFPTKAIRGWLHSPDDLHVEIVAEYFRRSGGWATLNAQQFLDDEAGDPLWGVWATKGEPLDQS